jgi:hypothetical protein
MTPCHWLWNSWCFEGGWCFVSKVTHSKILLDFADEGTTLLWNIRNCMVSHPRRLASSSESCYLTVVDCTWNVMAHAQKPDLVFWRNGCVHLNQWGHQFSRLLAAEVCGSAVVMLDTMCSEVAWEYWLPTPFASFPFSSPPVCHRVLSGFKWTLPTCNDFGSILLGCDTVSLVQ